MISIMRSILVFLLSSNVVSKILLCFFQLILQSSNLLCLFIFWYWASWIALYSSLFNLSMTGHFDSCNLVSFSFSPNFIKFSQHFIDQCFSKTSSILLSIILSDFESFLWNPIIFLISLKFRFSISLIPSKEPNRSFIISCKLTKVFILLSLV